MSPRKAAAVARAKFVYRDQLSPDPYLDDLPGSGSAARAMRKNDSLIENEDDDEEQHSIKVEIENKTVENPLIQVNKTPSKSSHTESSSEPSNMKTDSLPLVRKGVGSGQSGRKINKPEMNDDEESVEDEGHDEDDDDNMMVKGGKRKAPDSVKSNNTKIKHKDDNMPSPTKRAKTTPTAKFSGQGKSITVKRDPSEETTPKDEEQDGYDDNTDVKPKTNNSKSKTSPSKSSTSVSSPFTHLDLSALGRLPASMDSSKLDKFAPSPLLRLALLNEALRQVKATSMDWEKVVRDAEELGM